MKRIVVGVVLILIFFLVCWQQLATEGTGGDTKEGIGGLVLLLLIPGIWLTYAGWRSRFDPTEPRRKFFLAAAVAVTIAPFAWIFVDVMVEGSRIDAVLEPLSKGIKSPAAIEAELFRFIERGPTRRAHDVVHELIRLAIPGTEPLIIKVFERYPARYKDIAELLVNSGNSRLDQHARESARKSGYQVSGKLTGGDTTWKRK